MTGPRVSETKAFGEMRPEMQKFLQDLAELINSTRDVLEPGEVICGVINTIAHYVNAIGVEYLDWLVEDVRDVADMIRATGGRVKPDEGGAS